jgi:hypothetical protein
MTSQITGKIRMNATLRTRNCEPPAGAPSDYCRKLKSGLARLEEAIRLEYEPIYPAARQLIAAALREARDASWATPFPSLFFPALAHLKLSEIIPSA